MPIFTHSLAHPIRRSALNAFLRQPTIRAVALVFGMCLSLAVMTGCGATRETAKVDVVWQSPIARLEPAEVGQDKVWIDFQNVTGGTDDLLPHIEAAIIARGYHLAKSHKEADFVLWTTLRFFDKVDENNSSARNAIMAGAVIGGAAGGVTGYASAAHRGINTGASTAGGVVGGAIIGAGAGYAINYFTSEEKFEMILDVQLGRKISGGVMTTEKSGTGNDAKDHVIGAAETNAGTLVQNSTNSATSGQKQEMKREKAHFETENRICIASYGNRLKKEDAFGSILDRLKNALPQTLPRPPRAQ